MQSRRAELAGSAPNHANGVQPAHPIPADEKLTATIVLRSPPAASAIGQQLLSGTFDPLSNEGAAAKISADPQDMAAVQSFADQFGLQVIAADPAKRTVKVEGTVRDFENAFGIELASFGNYISYQGPITLPESLAGAIVAVLGLDNRPIARPREPFQ